MAAEKRPALGRGLSALISESPAAQPPAAPAVPGAVGAPPAASGRGAVQTPGPGEAQSGAPPPHAEGPRDHAFDLDLDLLEPNPFQPRARFDEAALDELARSLRRNGVIQPIVARRRGDRYEIIAGERRWRAAQRAGLLKVPVVIRDTPDDKLLEVALIENLQREDLNPIDAAVAYKRLVDDFQLTQEQIAEAVGKDRTTIANHLRLLKLPKEARELVAGGTLSMGHARALVSLEDATRMTAAARDSVARRLSVRETEALVRRLQRPATPTRAEPPRDVHTAQAEERLRLALGTRVRIVRSGTGGRVEIDFVSEEELNRIYEYMTERR